MKKNLLFIHVFWLFLAAFVSTFIYAAFYKVNGVLLLHDSKTFIQSFWPCIVIAIICLGFAIPLGLCPEKKNAKIECAILEILIIIGCFATVEVLSSGGKIGNVSSVFAQTYHYFVAFGVLVYLAILSLVSILKVMFTIVFKNEESNPKYASQISLALTPALYLGGLFALYFSALLYMDKDQVSTFGGYIRLVDTKVLFIILAVFVVMVVLHVFASSKTKNGLAPLCVGIVGFVCGIILAILLNNDVVKPSGDFEYVTEVSKFLIGAYLFTLLVLAISYALKPFISFIASKDTCKDHEEVKNDETEEAIDEIEESVAKPAQTKEAENEDVKALKEELAKANEEIETLNKKLEEHIASNVHIDTAGNAKKTFTTENLTDKSHYETELKTTVTRGFKAKLIVADDALKQTYSDLLNIPFKYKRGNVRNAFAKTTIVLGRTKVAVLKMSPSSKAMYLYLNLPASYLEISKYHLKDYTEKTKSLAATPYRLRIKSDRSMKYALELLEAAYKELGADLYKTERPYKDFTEELGPQTEDQMIENGLIKKKVVEETYLVEPVFALEDINKEQNTESSHNKVVEDEEKDDDDFDDESEDAEESEEE